MDFTKCVDLLFYLRDTVGFMVGVLLMLAPYLHNNDNKKPTATAVNQCRMQLSFF